MGQFWTKLTTLLYGKRKLIGFILMVGFTWITYLIGGVELVKVAVAYIFAGYTVFAGANVGEHYAGALVEKTKAIGGNNGLSTSSDSH